MKSKIEIQESNSNDNDEEEDGIDEDIGDDDESTSDSNMKENRNIMQTYIESEKEDDGDNNDVLNCTKPTVTNLYSNPNCEGFLSF